MIIKASFFIQLTFESVAFIFMILKPSLIYSRQLKIEVAGTGTCIFILLNVKEQQTNVKEQQTPTYPNITFL